MSGEGRECREGREGKEGKDGKSARGQRPRRRLTLVLFIAAFALAHFLPGGGAIELYRRTFSQKSVTGVVPGREPLSPPAAELLDELTRRIPLRETILLVTEGRGREAWVLYHRMLVELHPRRVVWATFEPPRGWPLFRVGVERSAAAVETLARKEGAGSIVATALPPLPWPWSIEALPAGAVLVRRGGLR